MISSYDPFPHTNAIYIKIVPESLITVLDLTNHAEPKLGMTFHKEYNSIALKISSLISLDAIIEQIF